MCMTFIAVMPVITVRIDDKTKRMMENLRINWSEFIRNAIKRENNGGEKEEPG